LAVRPQRRLRSGDILNALSEVISECGVPQFIHSDHGPEFIAKEVQSWFEEMGIGTIHIDLGSPWQNGHVESFSQSTA
jgi:putative transposase